MVLNKIKTDLNPLFDSEFKILKLKETMFIISNTTYKKTLNIEQKKKFRP